MAFVVSRKKKALGGLAVTALTVPVALAVSATSSSAATITVAADGSGNYRTIQEALRKVSSESTIKVKAGTYQGQVSIPSDKSGIVIVGATGNPEDVVITGRKPQSASSASGSATVLNMAKNTTIKAVTMANTYGRGSQALALYAGGDRQVYDNVRLLGHQDTLLSWTGNRKTRVRQYIHNSYIEGDVDFIYGNGTLVIDRSTIYSLTRNSSNNGYITAASTYSDNTYGILINRSTLTGNASAGSVALGRCWHAGGAAEAKGQVLVRDSKLGGHIRQKSAWQDMSGFSWKTCRFTEYQNSGTGRSSGTSDRPLMSASNAAKYTPQKYLAGSDSWNPVK
ncbi:MAG: pectinesterase [Actinomycetota bacterium]|nr:pectinesterase [Actinomycetota bacterium]